MATEGLSMRKLREILRQKWTLACTHWDVATSLQVGIGTTLGRIIRLVEEAQRSAAPVQRLANRYAQFYAPIAFAVASGDYFLAGGILQAITVLIVFCPCALVLATPTAVLAGIGDAAKRTVLVKGGAQLEAAGRIEVVAFDKTGTLTRGEPSVTDIVSREPGRGPAVRGDGREVQQASPRTCHREGGGSPWH
jgi:P-type E1-E2 ATPase